MLLMALFVTATFVAVIVRPHGIAEMFPRAQMVPILFGSIVIILGEVVIWSYVWRTPLLLVLTIVGVLLLFWADRFHDVRFVGNPVARERLTGISPRSASRKQSRAGSRSIARARNVRAQS